MEHTALSYDHAHLTMQLQVAKSASWKWEKYQDNVLRLLEWSHWGYGGKVAQAHKLLALAQVTMMLSRSWKNPGSLVIGMGRWVLLSGICGTFHDLSSEMSSNSELHKMDMHSCTEHGLWKHINYQHKISSICYHYNTLSFWIAPIVL